jgi:DNA polymerase-3 subunit epsilon
VFCSLFPKLCANATTVREALLLARPKRRKEKPKLPARRAMHLPDFGDVPDVPGVYVFRNAEGQPLYVGKSVRIRSRARSHFAPSSPTGDWTAQASIVDHRATRSELGALLLENRLIKSLHPPGNVRLKHQDAYVYLRCRFDIDYPILEVAPEPAAGHAVNVGPLRGRAAAAELKEQLDSLFSLRHCPRKMPRRWHPSAYGQMGRCLSPCLGDLDPNLYRRRLDAALELFSRSSDGGAELLAHVERQMREAAAEQRFERAAWLRRRHARLSELLARLGPFLRAAHAHPRLVLAGEEGVDGRDAFWLVGGRVVDWGAVTSVEELVARTEAARRTRAEPYVPPDEVAELRIVSTWLDAHDVDMLELEPRPSTEAVRGFAQRCGLTELAVPSTNV